MAALGVHTKPDAAGAFVLDGMPPGKLALIARSDSHIAAGLTRVEVVVRVQRATSSRARSPMSRSSPRRAAAGRCASRW
jgi:hypothetical protein